MPNTSSAKNKTVHLSATAQVTICRKCGAVLYVADQTRHGYVACGLCGNKWKLEVTEPDNGSNTQ